MIVTEKPSDVVKNGKFETTGFAVANESFIFDMVSNGVYTHKEKAVLREIGCNAVDSHKLLEKQGGIPPKNVNIHLPTFSNPYVSFRDYGVGLTEDEVRNTYCTIGLSTKTNSNDFTGCLGIGSLSPYCISDSFHVMSYKDGEKSTYVCHKNEERKGEVSLLLREETDEPNGLEVKINVPSGMNWSFREEAIKVFKNFEVVPDFNLDEVKDSIDAAKAKMDVVDGLYYLNKSGSRLVAIMGNVEYNIPQAYNKYDLSGGIYFDMGSLKFSPGREELSLDQDTLAALKDGIEKVVKRLSTDIIAEIELEDDAISKIIKFHSYKDNPVWGYLKKSSVADRYKKPVCSTEFKTYSKHEGWGKSKIDINETTILPVKNNVGYFLNKAGYHARIRYNITNGIFNTIILLTQEQIDEMNIGSKHIQYLSDLYAPESTKKIGTSSRVFGWNGNDYDGKRATENWDECTVPDNEEKVYIEIARYKPVVYYNFYYVNRILNELNTHLSKTPKIYGIKTGFLKTKKFKEQNWISLKDYAKREATALAAETVRFNNCDVNWNKLNEVSELVSDKDINYLINNRPNNRDLIEFLTSLGYEITVDNSLNERYSIVADRYPMVFRQDTDSITKYMEKINGDTTKTA